jgi:pantoate--beta-alanine ligase
VRDLNYDIEIVAMPTVREPDGLAMSSRNAYLAPDERVIALRLSRALNAAHQALKAGETDPRMLERVARAELELESGVTIEYVEVRDATNLQRIAMVSAPAVIAIAARVGKTRLIDNLVLDPAAAKVSR